MRAFPFLFRHPASGLLYFRLSVPPQYRAALGKTELKRSLRTYDKRIAVTIAARLYLEAQQLFSELDQGETMKRHNADIQRITIGEITTPSGITAKDVTIDTGDHDRDTELARKLIGGTSPTVNVPAPSTADSIKLADALKKYRAEKQREGSWADSTLVEHEALHHLLVQVIGNPDISTITHKQAREFKEILLQLPSNMTKGRYKGKSVKQLLAMSIPDESRMAPRTVNERLQRLSSFFLWSVRHGYCSVNVFDGLKLRISKRASEERAVFDNADLQTLFDRQHFNRDRLKPFQYWCTLLALFTGGRAGEIAQLRTCDVFEQDGIHAIRITDEAGRLKTLSSRREIPIHPALIENGFLEYVASIRADGHEQLFPDAHGNVNGAGDRVSRWFAHYRKRLGVGPAKKGDGPSKCFHSFRHCVANGLKQAGVEQLTISQILGHGDQHMSTGRYGKDYQLPTLHEALCKLSFPI